MHNRNFYWNICRLFRTDTGTVDPPQSAESDDEYSSVPGNLSCGHIRLVRCLSADGTHTKVNKTRRMAIANGTCVSFCYQPKAHYLATSREWRRYVVAITRLWVEAFGYVKTQESLRHIFASPGYAPRIIAVNLLDGKRIQCLSNASQHVKCKAVMKKLQFSTNISLYRGNGWR